MRISENASQPLPATNWRLFASSTLGTSSALPVFASSPLRGEDNDGFAQRCRREVGVTSGNASGGPESPPPRTASSIFVKYENRAVRSSPLKGEEEKNGTRVPVAIPYPIDLLHTRHPQSSQTVSPPPPLRGRAGVGGNFGHHRGTAS